MSTEYIFDIENLHCAYGRNPGLEKRVLNIVHLAIPKGKIVFFVGPSGIGKSTILEVLGLMNDTVVSADKFLYKQQDMRGVWTSWNDNQKSDFRNKEFSFIFQDNNLMPNFSAFENVIITAMFQGKTQNQCLTEIKDIFDQLGLPIEQDRSIQEFSGGQRQRLAFARAILPDFEVLFGDEPTGNLDRKNAEDVLKILQNKVHERNVTAIIVSHDMRLAAEYADMIIQIRQKTANLPDGKQRTYGLIDDNSLFYKKNDRWYDSTNLLDTAEMIKNLEKSLEQNE